MEAFSYHSVTNQVLQGETWGSHGGDNVEVQG
jgi:hypothetical protein